MSHNMMLRALFNAGTLTDVHWEGTIQIFTMTNAFGAEYQIWHFEGQWHYRYLHNNGI